jgi:beta-1,2-mannosidase
MCGSKLRPAAAMSLRAVAAAILLFAAASMGQSWTFGPFVKHTGNPVLGPALTSFLCPIRTTQVQFERRDVMNPAAIVRNGKVYIFYRCEDTVGPTSRIGMAQSNDGFTFTRSSAPAIYPQNDAYKTYEWPGGCEDPRIAEDSAGTYYLTYTAYNGSTCKLSVATSTDLVTWLKRGPVFRTALSGKYLNFRTKSSGILTKLTSGRPIAAKINGHYWMYWGESPVFLAYSDDLINWTPVENANGTLDTMIAPRQGYWDNLFSEAGTPPLLTDQGILFLYNAATGQTWPGLPSPPAFAPGQILFDKNNPATMVARTTTFFMAPDQTYETIGITKNCCFIQGLVYFNSRWLLYYGAADTRVAVAVYTPPVSTIRQPLPSGHDAAVTVSITSHGCTFFMPPGSFSEIAVADISGRIVRTLQADKALVRWDGRDHQGNRAPPGIYVVRFSGKEKSTVQKIAVW